jgi:hypothetical protein
MLVLIDPEPGKSPFENGVFKSVSV